MKPLPGPTTLNPLGFLGPVRRDIIGFLNRVAAEYGDVAAFRVGPMRVVLLNHPQYVQEVLVTGQRRFVKGRPLELAKNLLGEGLLTSDRDVHRRHRRIVQPAFHRERIESYGRVMTDHATKIQLGWQDGETVDIMQEMMRMALAIAGRTMLNTDVEADAGRIGEALVSAMSLFDRLSIPGIEFLLRMPLPSSLRFRRAKRTLDAAIYEIIRDRRSRGRDKDLLSMLVDLRDEEGDQSRLTDQEVRDQALIFLLAAYDTTALALTWTWYLLSENPAVEQTMHDELAAVLDGGVPSIEDLPRLTYTHAVFAESMRLFPPGYVLARRALEDVAVGPYQIRRGTTVLVSPYLIQRDPRFYEQPERFYPERWKDPTAHAGRQKFSYFPFGGGARTCIGESFSWTEGVLVLATIAQQWTLRRAPGQQVAFLPLLNLRPKYGMRMILRRRLDTSAEGAHRVGH